MKQDGDVCVCVCMFYQQPTKISIPHHDTKIESIWKTHKNINDIGMFFASPPKNSIRDGIWKRQWPNTIIRMKVYLEHNCKSESECATND